MPAAISNREPRYEKARRRPASSREEERSSNISDCESHRNLPDCAISCAAPPATEAKNHGGGHVRIKQMHERRPQQQGGRKELGHRVAAEPCRARAHDINTGRASNARKSRERRGKPAELASRPGKPKNNIPRKRARRSREKAKGSALHGSARNAADHAWPATRGSDVRGARWKRPG